MAGSTTKGISSVHFSRLVFARLGVIFGILVLGACGGGGNEKAFKEAVAVNELNVIAIEVSSDSAFIEPDELEAFSAWGTVQDDPGNPIDVTNRVTWSSSNNAVATINSAGILTGRSVGMVTVRADWADLNDSAELTVSDALLESITIEGIPSVISECAGAYQLGAKGTYSDSMRDITTDVTWSTNDLTLATISAEGVLTTLGAGAITLIATRDDLLGDEVRAESTQTIASNLSDIVVSPGSAAITVGQDQQYTATGNYTNVADRVITAAVTWQSGDNNVIRISNEDGAKGFAEAIAAGGTTIKASCGDPDRVFVSNEVPVTVEGAAAITGIEINGGVTQVEVDLAEGSLQLEARLVRSDGSSAGEISENDDTTWSVIREVTGTAAEVSNTDPDKGLVTFTETGTSEIEVRYDDDTLGLLIDTVFVKVE